MFYLLLVIRKFKVPNNPFIQINLLIFHRQIFPINTFSLLNCNDLVYSWKKKVKIHRTVFRKSIEKADNFQLIQEGLSQLTISTLLVQKKAKLKKKKLNPKYFLFSLQQTHFSTYSGHIWKELIMPSLLFHKISDSIRHR